MQKYIIAGLLIALFVSLLMLAIRSVRKRAAYQGLDIQITDVDSLNGDEIAEASVQYVSTVFSNAPLSRVVAKGLMHRGQARLSVLTDGLIIDRTGEASIAIASANLLGISRASATIDRGTEEHGLLAIDWLSGDQRLSTNLRLVREDDTTELFETLTALANKGVKA